MLSFTRQSQLSCLPCLSFTRLVLILWSLAQQPTCIQPSPTCRCCSIDGDADRLIYFMLPQASAPDRVSLLDGDRIAALIASFVSDTLKGLPQEAASSIKVGPVP